MGCHPLQWRTLTEAGRVTVHRSQIDMTNDFHTCLSFVLVNDAPSLKLPSMGSLESSKILTSFSFPFPSFHHHQDLWILIAHTTQITTDLLHTPTLVFLGDYNELII